MNRFLLFGNNSLDAVLDANHANEHSSRIGHNRQMANILLDHDGHALVQRKIRIHSNGVRSRYFLDPDGRRGTIQQSHLLHNVAFADNTGEMTFQCYIKNR